MCFYEIPISYVAMRICRQLAYTLLDNEPDLLVKSQRFLPEALALVCRPESYGPEGGFAAAQSRKVTHSG